jgi:hypothetical protein
MSSHWFLALSGVRAETLSEAAAEAKFSISSHVSELIAQWKPWKTAEHMYLPIHP